MSSNSHPIDLYTEAQDSLRKGDEEVAAQKLSQALGSEKTTQPIRNAVGKFLTPGTYPHDIALRLLEAVLRRRR